MLTTSDVQSAASPDSGQVSTSTPSLSTHLENPPSVPDQRYEASRIRIPMKRTHDERERNSYGSHGSRTPLESERASDIDSYRPHRGLESPMNTRDAFVRERDHWSPRQERRTPSPSPPPPPPPRQPAVDDRWPRPPSSSSTPLGHEHHDSSFRDNHLHRNLTWRAPALQQRQMSDPLLPTARTYRNAISPTSADPAAKLQPNLVTPARRDYEGLKGVPTGPKQSHSHVALHVPDAESLEPAAESPLIPSTQPKRDHEGVAGVPTGPKKSSYRGTLRLPDMKVKLHPHIFISGQHLPPIEATRKHLAQFLRGFDVRVDDVYVDSKGYYIAFENTDAGHERLKLCFKHQNRSALFRQYPLEMECFLSGRPEFRTALRPSEGVGDSSPTSADASNRSSVREGPSKAGLFSDGPESSFQLDAAPQRQVVMDSRVRGRETASSPLSATSPLQSTGPANYSLLHSSPLRIPSRQEKDDSSSASGLTSSDMSAPKRATCHVCNNTSQYEIEPLFHCSSCPRRYHSRCSKIPIPADLSLEHSWQCHRCIRRQVQPKSRLSAKSLTAEISPMASADQSEEPAPKRPRVDYLQSTPVDEPRSTRAKSDAIVGDVSVKDRVDRSTRPNEAMRNPGVGADIDTPARERAPVHSDDVAHELVEKSFTISQGTKPMASDPTIKPGRLNLFRKKLNEPQRLMSATSGNQRQSQEGTGGPSKEERLDEDKASAQPVEHTDEQKRKKKSHKWAGGGADKDIIRTGLDGFSMPPHEAGHDETADEHRTETTDAAPKQDANRVTGPVPQRKRPGAPAVVPCSKCGRKIASNPSGTNKYCTRCKKGMSLDLGSDSTRATLARTAQGKQKTPELISGDASALRNEEASKTAANPSAATDQPDRRDRPSSSGSLRRPQSREACEVCKANQTHCTHGLLAAKTMSKQSEDLDFWTVKKAPKRGVDASDKFANNGNVNANKDEDSTSDLSELEDVDPPGISLRKAESNPATPVKLQGRSGKRVSHTTIAVDEKDLGNSFERPKNTYKKLISMALCGAPGHRLRSAEMVQWVAKNIPKYKIGEGHGWEKNLLAIVSFNCVGSAQCRQPLWKKIPLEPGAKKNTGHFYELLPGLDENLLHWDPALQEPVTPPKDWRLQLLPSTDEGSTARVDETSLTGGDDLQPQPSTSTTTLLNNGATSTALKRNGHAAQSTSHRHKRVSTDRMDDSLGGEARSRNGAGIEYDGSMYSEEAVDSSDDEPIARRKRMSKALIAGLQQSPVEHEDDGTVDMMDVDAADHEAWLVDTVKPTILVHQLQTQKTQAALFRSREFTLSQSIRHEAENIDYSAKSLFDEHPEHDPSNSAFDRQAKITEIRKRPNRKKRMGTKSLDPWFEAKYTKSLRSANPALSGRSSLLSERMLRTPRIATSNVYPWENGESSVKHFNTLEAFFDLPSNPIAILHDGQLAFRDGTRNEDGTLPRAKVVYKTGYA